MTVEWHPSGVDIVTAYEDGSPVGVVMRIGERWQARLVGKSAGIGAYETLGAAQAAVIGAAVEQRRKRP